MDTDIEIDMKENIKMKRYSFRWLACTLSAVITVNSVMICDRVFAEESDGTQSGQEWMVPEESDVVYTIDEEVPSDSYDYGQLLASVYRCVSCSIYSEPSYESAVIGELTTGQQVQILNVDADQGVYWAYVRSTDGGESYGYVDSRYLITSQTRTAVLSGAESGSEDTCELTGMQVLQGMSEAEFEDSIATFPESYKPYLRNLHSTHPNWIFVPQNTGIDWSTFIAAEMEPRRSLIERSVPDSYKGKYSWSYDAATDTYYGLSGDNWVQASESAVKYFADPRNFLNDQGVFQFELLGYNGELQTEDGVEAILSNSFMSHAVLPDDEITYAQALCRLGSENQISPYMLAARVLQEQGRAGTSPLISGTYPGYEGLYNYYNIGAYGDTAEAIYVNGLTRAREEEWNTRFRSLQGGARTLSGNYISKGQDTLYLQKFHVVSNGYIMFSHQYMQNIRGAVNEARTVYTTYSSIGILDQPLIFKIPYYNNMPVTRCPSPEESANSELEAFVTRLYRLILEREPDESGLYGWVSAMQESGTTAARVVEGFFYSNEFTNRSLTDEEYVEILYETLLNRPSDENGKAAWTKILRDGCSRRAVLVGFVNSKEFNNLCNSFGVVRGSLTTYENRDINSNTTAFVTRLYRTALGREPEVDGLNAWTGVLYSHETDLHGIANSFIFSPEFILHNYSDEEYVTILYRTFLDREPDEAGKQAWVGVLKNGATRLEVMNGFVYSKEYTTLAAEYGL